MAKASPVWINRGEPYWPFDFAKIEQIKKAVYVGDFCILSKSNSWTELPVSLFYKEIPDDPSYSNYFGLYISNSEAIICNGISATEGSWTGVVADDGEIIYSRYRNDHRVSGDGSVNVDGGRDYFRASFGEHNPVVGITIVRDKLVVNQTLMLPVCTPKVSMIEISGMIPPPPPPPIES